MLTKTPNKSSKIKPNLPVVEEVNKHDFQKEFPQWLIQQKRIWLNARKNQELLGKTPITGIRNLFLSQEQMIVNSVWHIIQVNFLSNIKIF